MSCGQYIHSIHSSGQTSDFQISLKKKQKNPKNLQQCVREHSVYSCFFFFLIFCNQKCSHFNDNKNNAKKTITEAGKL